MRSLASQQTAADRRIDLRSSHRARRGLTLSLSLLVIVATTLTAFAASATAALGADGPAWEIQSIPLPTNFTREDSAKCTTTTECDAYVVTITNVGDRPSSGTVVLRDVLPAGVVTAPSEGAIGVIGGPAPASPTGSVHCPTPSGAPTVMCEYEGGEIPPGGTLTIGFEVVVTSKAPSSLINFAEVRGGGAAPAVTAAPGTVANQVTATAATPFNVQSLTVGVFGADGAQDVQAGDHPESIATTVDFTTFLSRAGVKNGNLEYPAVHEPKSQIVALPLGLVGDPLAAGQCSEAALRTVALNPGRCPADSQVGVVTVDAGGQGAEGKLLYNIVPEAGYPAEFGFEFDETLFFLRASVVPSPAGYELRVSVPDIARARPIKVTGATVVFFGDPTAIDGSGNGEAFFTNPDDCAVHTGVAHLEMDSWVNPEHWVPAEAQVFDGGVSGCGLLRFEPSIEVAPEESRADTPSGYEIDLRIPQSRNVPGVLATPDLRDAVVRLPEGVAISPSAANGLAACREAGPEGINITQGWEPTGAQPLDAADPEAMEIGEDGLTHVAPGHCPPASQVGEVEVVTPVLAAPLKGHVYVAEPECGEVGEEACTQADAASGKLFGIYLEVAGSGIVVKLRGKVTVNPQTGQITTSFLENPQFPFSELKLRLNSGSRAPLANPQSCGTFTTTSDLTPWSAPETPDATPSSSFGVGGCGGGFAPAFAAGTVSPVAGAYSPFTLTFSRNDGEQDLSGLTVTMPEGLVGKVAGIARCGEAEVKAAEANTGGCPAASRVGTATAGAGAGATPFYQSGNVYLTGPYNGAPFGLAVVVPANAGPFHLGNIVVRAAIEIDPSTAQVTVVSNPLPQMIDGVPLRVKTVNVAVGQENNFTFNATDCDQQSIAASIASAQNATANVASPYQAQGCKGLKFAPAFSASTVGKASETGGASLDVKVAFPAGPAGTYANIKSVKVSLPKQLPSRLATLQKACVAAVFEADPANCPAASDVGTATATTPLLNVPVSGPAYLVSHGGGAFPDFEIVLQGEGVRVLLDFNTQIKHGVTSLTLKASPDVPVSSFEVKSPTGKYSALGANVPEKDHYSLCGQKLAMPTEVTGQNGAVIKQATKIAVTGCAKAKKATKQKTRRKATKSNRRSK